MRKLSRRQFAQSASALALFSPFISLLDPPRARAQGETGPAKYLLIVTTNGTDPQIWESGTMTGSLNQNPDVLRASNFNSNGSAGNHGAIGALTGTGSYGSQVKSLDFYVADDLRARGIVTQVPSLHLGGVSGQTGIGFRNNSLQAPTYSPTAAFSSIFDGAAPAAPPPPVDGAPPAADVASPAAIRALRRQTILDVVRGEVTRLKGALGSSPEGQKLDQHLQSIRELEQRIEQQLIGARGGGATTGGGSTTQFVQPVSCEQPVVQGGLQDVENSVVHLELAVAAFACDVTRVAHVEFGHHQACNVDMPEIGAQGDWHNDFMHSGQRGQDLINLENWLSDRFVDLIARLKATNAPDGRGNLYDQTYVLWVREMGDAIVHAGDNMPFVLSGGAGGYLTQSRARLLNGGGAAHASLLLNAAEAMGVTNFSGFGTGNATPFGGLRA